MNIPGVFGSIRSRFGHAFGEFKVMQGNSEAALAYGAAQSGKMMNAASAELRTAGGAFFNSAPFANARSAYTMGRGHKAGVGTSLWSALGNLDTKDIFAGKGAAWKHMGWSAGAGAVAGAGRSYYDGDGFGGYAGNMMKGAGIGAAGSAIRTNYRTDGSSLNMMKGNWGALGSALRGK